MEISKVDFEQLLAEGKVTKSFEFLDINCDNKISEADLSLTQNDETKQIIQNLIITDTDEDSDAEGFDIKDIDKLINDTSSTLSAKTIYNKAKQLTLSATIAESQKDRVEDEAQEIFNRKEAKEAELNKLEEEIEKKEAEYTALLESSTIQTNKDSIKSKENYDYLLKTVMKNYAEGKYGTVAFNDVMASELSNLNINIENTSAEKLTSLGNEIGNMMNTSNALAEEINTFSSQYNEKISTVESLQNTYNSISSVQADSVEKLNEVNSISSISATNNINESSQSTSCAGLDTVADADKIDWNALYVEGLGININIYKQDSTNVLLNTEEYNFVADLSKKANFSHDGQQYWIASRSGGNEKDKISFHYKQECTLEDVYKWDLDSNGFLSDSEVEFIESAKSEYDILSKKLNSSYSLDDYLKAIDNGEFGDDTDLMRKVIKEAENRISTIVNKEYNKHLVERPGQIISESLKTVFYSDVLEEAGSHYKNTGALTVINGQQVVVTENCIYNENDTEIMAEALKSFENFDLFTEFSIAESLTKANNGTCYDPYDLEALNKAGIKYELATNKSGEILYPLHANTRYYEYTNSTGVKSLLALRDGCGLCLPEDCRDSILRPMYLMGKITKEEYISYCRRLVIDPLIE